jgi:hypothetical protein
MRVGTTVNMTNIAAMNSITISCATSSIIVTKWNAILNGRMIMWHGAFMGHIIIFIGKNISLTKPIL